MSRRFLQKWKSMFFCQSIKLKFTKEWEMNYFSDKELESKDRTSEEITIEVWNGLISVFEEFKNKNCFSSKFTDICHDNGRACGFDERLFKDGLKSEIPNIEVPIKRKTKNNQNEITIGNRR